MGLSLRTRVLTAPTFFGWAKDPRFLIRDAFGKPLIFILICVVRGTALIFFVA
jgi:hypothetical protein